MFQDVLVLWPQWIIMAFIVMAHCLITFLLPVDNCPTYESHFICNAIFFFNCVCRLFDFAMRSGR